MPHALVTGGTGFVGRHLVPFLQEKGFDVAILARERNSSESHVDHRICDIRDAACVDSVLRETQPDWIFHLAGISAIAAAAADPQLTYEVNVNGARNLFAAAKQLSNRTRVLNVSTSQVYARSSKALTESSVTDPQGPYATSKAMAEAVAAQFDGTITARPFNHTGPGQPPNFVLSSIAKQFVEIESHHKKPILLLGNVHVRRDFTDVRDVIRAYWLLLDRGKPGETYNVCSGSAPSISELIDLLQEITGIVVEVQSVPGKIRQGETEILIGSKEKISREIGWQPEIALRKTVEDLLNYWRSELARKSVRSAHHAIPAHSL